MITNFNNKLDQMIPNPKCELNYNKDYELLIAVVLSAQCTDKRVNIVTSQLFKEYDIYSLATANKADVENIIRSCGSYTKKSEYLIKIAQSLVNDYNGTVPNNREYLEKLPGVGHKTANVVLSNLFDVPAIAVDTHVERVSKRLKIANAKDNVLTIEKKLMKKVPEHLWSRTHYQMVLFGRYICTAKKPNCQDCLFNDECNSKDNYIKKRL